MQYDGPDELFDAWCEGRTGFPFVDAGMRQVVDHAEGRREALRRYAAIRS